MTPLLLIALLAAPPKATAADASQLSAAKKWDQLYLDFSSGDPKAFSDADRQSIATALLQGAHAMDGTDAVMAVSLGERSVAFRESPDALVFAAQLEEKAQQGGQAALFLDRALALNSRDGQARLARAELALTENDAALALKQLDAIEPGFQVAHVRQLRAQAQAKLGAAKAGEAALVAMQKQVARQEAHAATLSSDSPPSGARPRPGAAPNAIDSADAVASAGLREQASDHFVFAYGNNARDWGQRAEYEGQVEEALEEAYQFVGQVMGVNRTQKVEVVLYTKEEYDFHFGGSSLSRAAGFFSGKIRINGAEEMTPEVRAVIVHEYTHAVIDEIAHGGQHCPVWVNEGFATYVENQYRDHQGMPGADDGWRRTLQAYAKADQLPKLKTLNQNFLEYPNPRLAYATACSAMKLLIERFGMDTFVQTLRDSATQPWDKLFAARFVDDLSKLDGDVREDLME